MRAVTKQRFAIGVIRTAAVFMAIWAPWRTWHMPLASDTANTVGSRRVAMRSNLQSKMPFGAMGTGA